MLLVISADFFQPVLNAVFRNGLPAETQKPAPPAGSDQCRSGGLRAPFYGDAAEPGAAPGLYGKMDQRLIEGRVARHAVADFSAKEAVLAQPVLHVFNRLPQVIVGKLAAERELGSRNELPCVGRIRRALDGDAADEIVGLRDKAQRNAIACGARVYRNVRIPAGCIQPLDRGAHIRHTERIANFEWKQAIELGRGERLSRGIELDKRDAPALVVVGGHQHRQCDERDRQPGACGTHSFHNTKAPGGASGCGLARRRRSSAA